LFLITK